MSIHLNNSSMDNTAKHLQDILTAIEEVDSFFGTEPKYFNEFADNLCLRRAVERNIEVIGPRPLP